VASTKGHKTFIFFLLLVWVHVKAQRYGLHEQLFGHVNGYVLFAPLESRDTYLIDKCGRVVNTWHSAYKPGQSVYLLPKGELLRSANDSNTHFVSGGGRIELYDWHNKLKWSYAISNATACLHHDIYPMPNGNVLAILWEKKTKAEALAAGRNPELLGEYVWNEKIIELKPKGKDGAEIVWYWDVWEHLVQDFDAALPNYAKIEEHPERININFAASKNEDWLHFNAITYQASTGEILVSNRNFSEIFIIQHRSDQHDAANKGNIIFRWGNAKAYLPKSEAPPQLFSQHSPKWIEQGKKYGGNIILFNNGNTRPGKLYSRVEIISPKKNANNNYVNDPDLKPLWMYADTSDRFFYSKNVSNAQMIGNGHVFVCEGASGRFFELDERNTIVWQYVNPVYSGGILTQGQFSETNRVFRAVFYAENDKVFRGHRLKPGALLCADQPNTPCVPGTEAR
jgi:hypothetical protein